MIKIDSVGRPMVDQRELSRVAARRHAQLEGVRRKSWRPHVRAWAWDLVHALFRFRSAETGAAIVPGKRHPETVVHDAATAEPVSCRS